MPRTARLVLVLQEGRSLLADIPGQDLHTPELPMLLDMVTLLVDLQHAWSGGTSELLALGLPDWSAAVLGPAIADVVNRTADELSADDRAVLRPFAEMLPERFADVAACGLADTLVHGDFWPGNLRGDRQSLTLLDWGDSGIGHPLLDQTAFLDRIPPCSRGPVREHWVKRWRAALPGSDPARASQLLEAVAAARQAVVFRGFLDRIEPAEHAYHRSDPGVWLQRTATLLRR